MLYVWVFCLHVCLCTIVHAWYLQVRRGPQVPRYWSYRWLLAAMWVLGTEWTQVLRKSSQSSWPLSPLPSPLPSILMSFFLVGSKHGEILPACGQWITLLDLYSFLLGWAVPGISKLHIEITSAQGTERRLVSGKGKDGMAAQALDLERSGD